MVVTILGGFGIPDHVLRTILTMWGKHKAGSADWGNYGYRLYRFTTKDGKEFWGLNIWKISHLGVYKSTDVSSIRDMELNDRGMLLRLYDRPPVQVLRSERK